MQFEWWYGNKDNINMAFAVAGAHIQLNIFVISFIIIVFREQWFGQNQIGRWITDHRLEEHHIG